MEIKWRGIHKLTEECGELVQVLGKIAAYPTTDDHPDGKGSLKHRAEDEVADVMAAMAYFCDVNGLDIDYIESRVCEKRNKFDGWRLQGILVEPVVEPCPPHKWSMIDPYDGGTFLCGNCGECKSLDELQELGRGDEVKR